MSIRSDLRALADKNKAKLLAGFFKTGRGEYGEGDIFLGIMVPNQRMIAKKYLDLPLADVVDLLHSKEHEFRLTALIILVTKYLRTDNESYKKLIFDEYLANTKWINNWDLVDLSAPQIVGQYLLGQPKATAEKILTRLAHSQMLWERRIAILATYTFIRNGNHKPTFKIAKILLHDKHDLIHKAVGWMLREVGKRCGTPRAREGKTIHAVEKLFLDKYRRIMPRTMLRYAIEHFSNSEKRKYLLK